MLASGKLGCLPNSENPLSFVYFPKGSTKISANLICCTYAPGVDKPSDFFIITLVTLTHSTNAHCASTTTQNGSRATEEASSRPTTYITEKASHGRNGSSAGREPFGISAKPYQEASTRRDYHAAEAGHD